MVIVESGKNWKGEPCSFYMHKTLKENLDIIKKVVLKKDFDYVAIICGYPGIGKTNFAMNLAKFCCEWFDLNYVVFTADDFIKLTETCPKHSAIVLDESFADLNKNLSRSKEFTRIINHLQIIRQRNLFLFICLPNFFDLTKHIALYRSINLFVVYGAEFGTRGSFAAFTQDRKRILYIKGSKFHSYHAAKPNFRGDCYKQSAVDEKEYDKKKIKHFKEQDKILRTGKAPPLVKRHRDSLIFYIRNVLKRPVSEVVERTGIGKDVFYAVLKGEASESDS